MEVHELINKELLQAGNIGLSRDRALASTVLSDLAQMLSEIGPERTLSCVCIAGSREFVGRLYFDPRENAAFSIGNETEPRIPSPRIVDIISAEFPVYRVPHFEQDDSPVDVMTQRDISLQSADLSADCAEVLAALAQAVGADRSFQIEFVLVRPSWVRPGLTSLSLGLALWSGPQ